jgi:hypothetical protein
LPPILRRFQFVIISILNQMWVRWMIDIQQINRQPTFQPMQE